MKKLKTVLTAAFAFVMLSGFHGGCRGERSLEGRVKRIDRYASNELGDVLDDINADEALKRQAFEVKDDLMEDAPTMILGQDRAKQLLRRQWQEERADAELIHQMIDERTKTISAFAHKLADGLIELHSMLDDDQRKEIQQMWD